MHFYLFLQLIQHFTSFISCAFKCNLKTSPYVYFCLFFFFFLLPSYCSYPRTESTAYPSSFDFKGTLHSLVKNPEWGDYVRMLLSDGYGKPRSGTDVGDHPPITPMGLATEDMLGRDAWRLYQYVCQHFIGSLSSDCKYIR